jgi:hypothetical protein
MIIFNYWSLVLLLANFVSIYACLTYLLRPYIPFAYNQFFIGMGCLLTWVSLTKYIEYSGSLSILSRTMSHTIPEILANLLNSIPIFMGFAMLGVAVFWNCYRF